MTQRCECCASPTLTYLQKVCLIEAAYLHEVGISQVGKLPSGLLTRYGHDAVRMSLVVGTNSVNALRCAYGATYYRENIRHGAVGTNKVPSKRRGCKRGRTEPQRREIFLLHLMLFSSTALAPHSFDSQLTFH